MSAPFTSHTTALHPRSKSPIVHLSSNRDFDLDTSFDVDDNLLDYLSGSVETI